MRKFTLTAIREDDASPYYTNPSQIKDPGIIITREKRIEIIFDYPISEPVTFAYTTKNKGGWTRKMLFGAIKEGYRNIYEDPDEYGVWGHDMQDLVIEAVHSNKAGNRFTLSVGS